MKYIFELIVGVVILMSTASCSHDTIYNPAGPGDETFTVTGKIVFLSLTRRHDHGMKYWTDTTITLEGNGRTETTTHDENGIYTFSGLSEGSYTLTPHRPDIFFGPPVMEIAVNKDMITVDTFYGCNVHEDDCIIGGRITEADDTPVPGVLIAVKGRHVYYFTNELGYYVINTTVKGETYSLLLDKDGYDYTFNPKSTEVTVTDNVTVRNFTAEYTGSPLYTMSGRVIGFDGEGITALVEIWSEDLTQRSLETDSSGVFTFPYVKNGIYILEWRGTYLSQDYRIEGDHLVVMVEGEDLQVPDVRADNVHTTYTIMGKIVDINDEGIPDIIVDVYSLNIIIPEIVTETTTDADGLFSVKVAAYLDETRRFTLIPRKKGFSFIPDSTSVTLSWIKGVKDGGEVAVPDFVGSDYSKLTAQRYFRVDAGILWTYRQSDGDGISSDYTVRTMGTVLYNGTAYQQFSMPGPWGFTRYRIDENDVYAISGEKEVLFLKFCVPPETSWLSGLVGNVYYRKGNFLGTETVETPAGIFDECTHFTSKIIYGDESHDTYDLWYAPGVGFVKSVKVVVNYGRQLEHITDELKSYDFPD